MADAKEQMQQVLKVAGKHHFWILCGVVALVAVGIFASASGDLARRYDERAAALDGKYSTAEGVLNTATPPNDRVIAATKEDIQKAKNDVLKAWEFLYKLQKDKNPWPAELGKEFKAVIDSVGHDGEIPLLYREAYRDFISKHYEPLFDIIDIRQEALLDENGKVIKKVFNYNLPGIWDDFEDKLEAGVYTKELHGKVVWESPEVLALGASWTAAPATFQVRLAQEDLWVYEALLRIIRDTNEGATSYHNAAIKRIAAMHIGAAGSAAFAMSSGGGSTDDGEYDDDGGGGGGGGVYYATTGMGSESALLQGRYVGEKGEPLAHDAAHPFAEFKMMPVRLVLLMDQRKIPDLLVNCANSSMPVEVKKVVIRPGAGGVSLDLRAMSGGGRGGGGGGGSDEDDYGGGEDGLDGGGGSGVRSGTVGGVLADSVDLPVEVQGVIFIFNPPDREKLGTGSAGEEPDEDVAPLQPIMAPAVGGGLDAGAVAPADAGGGGAAAAPAGDGT
jgi:hypothetical protein